MDKLVELNGFFKCFIIFGHKIDPGNRQKGFSHLFISSIPKLVYCLFVIYAVFFILSRRTWWSANSGLSYIATRMFLVLLMLSISLYTDMMHPMSSNVIYTHVGTMLKRVECQLNVKVSLKRVIRAMHRKVLVTYTIQAMSILTNMALKLDRGQSLDTDIFTDIVFAYRYWMSLYLLLFIDLFTLLLNSLNEGIERVTIENQSIDVKLQTVHTIKWLHFYLWKTANIFNRR